MQEADGVFINKISKGIPKSRAYIESYQANANNATIKAKALLKEPEFKEQLAKQGITLRRLNNTLKKQLQAKKAIAVSKDSTIEYVDDNVAIDNALTKGYKLYGVLKDNPNTFIDNRQVTFSGDTNKLLAIVNEMKQLKAKAVIDTTGEIV